MLIASGQFYSVRQSHALLKPRHITQKNFDFPIGLRWKTPTRMLSE